MVVDAPVERKSFQDGVRLSKLKRRLKALEAEEAQGSRIHYGWYRADPATNVLGEEAQTVLKNLQNSLATLKNPTKDQEMESKAKEVINQANGVIEAIEQRLKGFKNTFPNKKEFLKSFNGLEVSAKVGQKLTEHWDATNFNLEKTSSLLQEAKKSSKQPTLSPIPPS
ncbi:hypothetical protein ACQY0O_003444 [Thecaphora frezii]